MAEQKSLPYWVAAQADLSLCWSERSYCRFCQALAQIFVARLHSIVGSLSDCRFRGCKFISQLAHRTFVEIDSRRVVVVGNWQKYVHELLVIYEETKTAQEKSEQVN